ncbi:MAG TPA: glycosyltransferase [Gammaproteobacteria bacterium]|nr:glycosyltransferase [Gammaproteobacteria bacterium]
MSRVRVMLWVQHLMGIGHQRRAALIAERLCRRGAEVCYVSGGYPVPDLNPGAARLVQLPPARAADASYRTLLDERGEPVSAAWQRGRRELLLEAFDDFRPHALVTESYPFGRGLLRFELEPLIERASQARPRPRVICSVRDIIQRRSQKRDQAIAELVLARFDRVLVHSDPKVVEFAASFSAADAIRERLLYTGYVADDAAEGAAGEIAGTGVLVSGGGGVVAGRLLEAAIRARPLSRLRHEPWRVLAGPAVGEPEFQELKKFADGSVRVERNRADFSALLAASRVSVSQGGYNTLVDVIRARARAVVVPFSDGDQTEQPARARLFAGKDLVQVLASNELTPSRLAAAIDKAAHGPRPAAGILDLSGADRAAEMVIAGLGECA